MKRKKGRLFNWLTLIMGLFILIFVIYFYCQKQKITKIFQQNILVALTQTAAERKILLTDVHVQPDGSIEAYWGNLKIIFNETKELNNQIDVLQSLAKNSTIDLKQFSQVDLRYNKIVLK